MRQLAMTVAAFLVLAVISPAFAQPFADTPTNHWAYDAIAELAAKGLIEGYPDGTFKGDRAMTRYEMAMVVARLLARIESIQIPTPAPAPQPCRSGVVSNPSLQASTQPQAQAQRAPAGPPCYVTRADLDMILRLVNEFRAELAAKNVRLTAVEEELNAIKARLDNVRVTGSLRFRYDMNQLAANQTSFPVGTPLNLNPRTSSIAATSNPRGNRPRYEFKLGFDGSVSPNIHFITGIETANGYQFFNSSAFGAIPATTSIPGGGGFGNGSFGSIDSAFLDWKGGFGLPMEIWLGRFGATTPCGPCYPIQFGPFGLLLNDLSNTWGDTTGESGNNLADGIRLAFNFSQLADLKIQAVWVRITGNTGSLSFPSGEDAYGVDVNIGVIEGLRVGGYYVANSIGNFGAATGNFQPAGTPNIFWHLYGPGEGASLNPAGNAAGAVPGTAGVGGNRCIAVTPPAVTLGNSGITCPAVGNGYGFYAQWDAFPGIHLDLEVAQWSDTTPVPTGASVAGGTDYGYNVAATWNISTLVGICCNVVLTTSYEYYGANFYPPYGNAEIDTWGWDVFYPGNAQGFTGHLSFQPVQGFTIFGDYTTGNNVSTSQPFTEWRAGVSYSFAPNTKLTLFYRDVSLAGVDQENVYRAQVDYAF